MAETAGKHRENPVPIVDSNKKMFEVFKKRFKIPKQKHYEQAAQKLAEWLSNDRAYYPQARKEIVELLQTARQSLNEWVGLAEHSDLYPLLADAYIQLVLAVEPFRRHFVEPDLQATIQKLIAGVASVQNTSPAALQSRPPDPIHAMPLVLSTAINPSQQMRPSSSSLASALTPTTNTVHTNTPGENTSNAIDASVSDAQPQPVVPGITAVASAAAGGSTSAPVVKPKRKKKKKEDFSKFLQADVEVYNEKLGTVAKAVEVAQPTPAAVDVAGPVPPITSESAPTTVEEKKPSKAEAISDQPAPVPPQETHLDHQSEDVEMPDSHPQDAPNSGSGAPTEVLTSTMDDEVNRVLRTLTGSVPSVHPDPTIPDVVPSDGSPPAPNEAMPLASSDVSLPTVRDPLTTLEAVLDSDTTSMEGLVNTSPLDRPAAFQAIFETMVNKVNELIATSTDASVPATSLPSLQLPTPPTSDERSPRPEGVEPLPSEDTTLSTKTGIETATVIARHQGLAAGTISIEFFINQNQLDSITKWNDRSKHSDDIRESLCITLLCFSAADARARLEASRSEDLRTILPDLECSWPKTGGLTMNALWKGQYIDFPMSPPFALPLNGLVDLSPFLILGQNTFRITQTRDMSNYWLILCAHHPTPAQVNAVARRRLKERDWTGWLEKISQPLQLPFKLPIEV